jgi:hypothetical protein
MRQGSYDAIETLERAWLQLAKFYPPAHFGDRIADHFSSDFIAERFAWHRQLSEPRGPGSSGTIVNVTAAGAVLDDVANAIEETVEGLYIGYALSGFDLKKWRSEWAAANLRDTEEDQENGCLHVRRPSLAISKSEASMCQNWYAVIGQTLAQLDEINRLVSHSRSLSKS